MARKDARKTLVKATRRHADQTLLLPPFVSASELRIIFRMDYAGIFRLLGVQFEQSKYFWRDYDGREYETTSKRKVLVPYELAAVPASGLGLRPKMVDVEPDWDQEAATGSTALASAAAPVPVVAVLGHIDHGKTTLLDALCGTSIAAAEPGGITQGVRAMTWDVEVAEPAHDEGAGAARMDPRRMTFIDTPGHEAFELQRGRTMATADAAIVVVSVERGAELQTEEVLMHAARWRVPIVFALNKIDLPTAHVELTRAELRRQCQRLHEQGLLDVDLTLEAEAAVPISALEHRNLGELTRRVRGVLQALPRLPARPVEPPTLTPGQALRCRGVQRRTDYLVGIESAPSAVALVVEVERGPETGEKVLTMIVRAGRLTVGQFFAVGTAFGRITHLAVSNGLQGKWFHAESATSGVAVQVMGLRTRTLGGDCAPDDIFYALPRERAWRLCEHRSRMEELSALQTAGPALEVPWEHDSPVAGLRTQAGFDRHRDAQPEKHSGGAYERRWQQPAVEEFGNEGSSQGLVDGTGEQALRPKTFSDASRRAFNSPLKMKDGRWEEASEPIAEEEPTVAQGGGRRSRRRTAKADAGPAADENRRFQVLRPSDGEEQEASASPAGGRRSGRTRQPTGAWTSSNEPESEFVYYADRTTFEEEADIDTSRLRSRWRWRDRARWEEQQRQDQLKRDEKKMAEAVRREVFGQPPLEDADDEGEEDEEEEAEERALAEPLPRRNQPVVPLILKTRTIGQFDVLMDEVERVQETYGCRVVIVHGGLGPVIPKDVVHAEVEKQYGYCPIYAFQVGVKPEAVGSAQADQIDVRRFDVFTDLVAEVEGRCARIQEKADLAKYRQKLKHRPRAIAG